MAHDKITTFPSKPGYVTIAPAPRFSWEAGGPSLATIYTSHYKRLTAVLDAARTGNEDLIAMAVAAQDAKGCDE